MSFLRCAFLALGICLFAGCTHTVQELVLAAETYGEFRMFRRDAAPLPDNLTPGAVADFDLAGDVPSASTRLAAYVSAIRLVVTSTGQAVDDEDSFDALDSVRVYLGSDSRRVLLGRIDTIEGGAVTLELGTSGVDVSEELMGRWPLVTEAEGEAPEDDVTFELQMEVTVQYAEET